jgi:heme a synthase
VEIERRRRYIRHAALACVVLLFAVTTLSAFVRLANLGLGGGPETEAVLMARDGHRIAAATVLLGVLALLVLSLGPRPYLEREGRHALALLMLAVFLAVVGRASAGVVTAPILLGNLLGGFLMFALAWRLAWPAARPLAPRLEPLAWLGAAALLLLVALVALHFSAGRPLGMVLALNIAALFLLAALLRRVRLPLLS